MPRLTSKLSQIVSKVLVFDGETPEIKKREIRLRNKRRKRKLGDSFYLGSGVEGEEENEEVLEATRHMAKRILAKQLRTGQLVSTKNSKKSRNKKLTTVNNSSNHGDGTISSRPSNSNGNADAKTSEIGRAHV